MRNRIMILTVLLVCIYWNHPINADEIKKEGRYWTGLITKTFDVQKNGQLIIKEVSGDITVHTWDKLQVKVHEIKRMDIFSKNEAEIAMKTSENNYQQKGDAIYIGGAGFNRKWIESNFEIWVPVEFHCNIETEGGDLDIENLKGDIKAKTGGGDVEIANIDGTINAITGGGDIRIYKAMKEVTLTTGGGDVEIESAGGPVNVTTGGGDVSVSETRYDVKVQTGGGDITINESQGNLDVKTGGGDIEISKSEGTVDVSTGGGDITLKNLKNSCWLRTGGGDVYGDNITGDTNIETGAGDIVLKNSNGTLNVVTGLGDVHVDMTLLNDKKGFPVKIRTGYGDIELDIPANMPASIQARVPEDCEISSDFSLTITTSNKSGEKYVEATGKLNGGGELIILETGSGDIHLGKK
jgi:DUF4097 and DUF4098 domain-containing protein YvlB